MPSRNRLKAATLLTTMLATPHLAQAAAASPNPFFAPSPLPFNYPQFDRIRDTDFAPAFDAGMTAHLAEVRAIADDPAPPTLANTLLALERSGQVLERATTVFFALVAADTNDARNQLRSDYAPRFAAHTDAILLDARLFARIEVLHQQRNAPSLDAEDRRLIERYHSDFVRAGARLPAADKDRLKAMNAELATLGTRFTQNVLDEVNAAAVVVDDVKQLDGLTAAQVEAAAAEAKSRGLAGKYVLTLLNTTGQPLEPQLNSRPLRQRLHEASVSRGSRGGEFDNREIVSRTMRLRAERATLLGYPDFATYGLEDQTARTPAAVNAMLRQLAPAAVANARREAADLQARIDADGGDFHLAPWDWAFYSEKVRAEKYAFDEAELKPYLELTNVLEKGVFHAASRLYGLEFRRRTDLPVYHPDVWVYDVLDADGRPLAIFIADMYARKSKRGGAWMNSHVSQSLLLGLQPVVANHLNIPKPPAGQPTLLTWDEVTTTFHEFGHALHGMFSNVKYPYFSGTSVPRDFVEFPSQVNEMWADWPQILRNYAVHHDTGEPMPQALLDKVIAASKFNQGFATTEYLAAALLDQRWHQLPAAQVPDATRVLEFEAAALAAEGVDFAAVPPRYRTTYFSHIMGGYQAGYYAYIWSEVLDADTQRWFETNGGLTRANGDRFRAMLLSRGGSVDAMSLYREFAGREPRIEALLAKRGLSATP
ncbi:MAG TPA: M3 family metallopeptidase [Steroidobacteraceae bacterium]|nr:M3 family metallopeptidase [Steroidobacteraceae bacterium]